jgi:thiamine-phosphate pyrophosphorylase
MPAEETQMQAAAHRPKPLDLRLYALLDPEHAGGRALDELAWLVAAGGATLVQLRDKHSDTRAMVDTARTLKATLRPFGIPLLINDRVDVALAAGADGVHVGQDDMAVEDARRLLGADAVIGLSIKTVAQAEGAPVDLLDYVGIGGVYATTSKDNPDPPIGVAGLGRVADVFRRRAPKLPLCAIAGIDTSNAGATIAAGADGVAVISVLSLNPNPADPARELRAIIDGELARRARA